MRYRADLTAGALKISESRIVADILLRDSSQGAWDKEVFEQNALRARNPETARRQGRMIRQRLELMTRDLWSLVRDGSGTVAAHACLAAAVKHSYILGDFLDLVIREHYRLFTPTVKNRDWEQYLEGCRGRDPELPDWSPQTKDRLRRAIFLVLAEAGYVESTKTMKLQANHIASPVIRYLEDNQEDYVLRCIQVRP